MKALKLIQPLEINLIPRFYPLQTDTLVLKLRHEITGNELQPTFTFEVGQKLKITITENLDYFKANQKFEIEVTNNKEIIYLGKLQTFTSETDIQNYEYKQQTNKRFDFK
jgi:hypothetical protein